MKERNFEIDSKFEKEVLEVDKKTEIGKGDKKTEIDKGDKKTEIDKEGKKTEIGKENQEDKGDKKTEIDKEGKKIEIGKGNQGNQGTQEKQGNQGNQGTQGTQENQENQEKIEIDKFYNFAKILNKATALNINAIKSINSSEFNKKVSWISDLQILKPKENTLFIAVVILIFINIIF